MSMLVRECLWKLEYILCVNESETKCQQNGSENNKKRFELLQYVHVIDNTSGVGYDKKIDIGFICSEDAF